MGKGEGPCCGVVYLRTSTEQLQTSEQGSKTLTCISFTKLNIHLLPGRVFQNFLWMFIDCYSTASKCYKETAQIPIFSGCSLTATQLQANATKRLHKFRNRSHFSRDAKRIYEKTCYSHAASVVSTVTLVSPSVI
ncbi:hypothetical protein CSKR_103532 [Clonorchis sinensis]|uniref:Uncharacterized protein n=1 Tax=Clonorchis sinensis TaxID=79923 RepID=A0A419PJ93_CLOSI|nr:hypothetical protein CSKR_103532 [Clonorchis sinensis]